MDDPADIAAFMGPTPRRHLHQCIFVELAGAGLEFANRSVYRNMDIETASKFERDAEISVVGLAPLGGTHRDTYLSVNAQNMPLNVPGGRVEPKIEMQLVEEKGRGSGPATDRGLNDTGHLTTSGTREPGFEDVDERVPSYTVRVWHSTGETATEGGVTHQLLEPQTSFGCLISHEGSIYGWNHSLSGAGLDEIAPNFYRLAVPNAGAARVSISIEALEQPGSIRVKWRGSSSFSDGSWPGYGSYWDCDHP